MAVNDLIQIRKGTASAWTSANPVLASGEPGYDLTNKIFKIGDGSSNWASLGSINLTSSNITDFGTATSGILPVKNIVAGSNITISSSSGTYTINSTASGTGGGSSSTSVIEYGTVSNFPASGVGSTIYISTDTGRIYRWAGSVYQELGPINTGAYASLNGIVTIPSTGDQYWDLVTLLLRCDGLNNSTKFVDSSSLSKTLTRIGSAVTSTVQYHAGISSLYFNGTDAVVEVGSAFDSTISGFGTADFTIEFWFRTSDTSTRVSVISSYDTVSPATGFVVQLNTLSGGSGSVGCGYGDNPIVSTSGSVWTANTWNHVAIVRSGSAWTVFVNGVSRGTATNSTSINAGAKMSIGALKAGSYIQLFSGYLDDIRITNGIARYSSTFIPSTDSYPVGPYIAPKTSSVVFS